MRKLIFLNNAAFKVTHALNDSDQFTQATADRTSSDANLDLPSPENGCFTIATITHESVADKYEIVYLVTKEESAGVLKVVMSRGQGGTYPQVWPAGALVECRVTAGMLELLQSGTMRDEANNAMSLNGGDVFVDWDEDLNLEVIGDAWAIGGLPIAPGRGWGDYLHLTQVDMAQQVEGVGYSNVVELGVAPNFDALKKYVPGDYAKDPNSPFWTYSYGRGGAFGVTEHPALGDFPWVRFDPAGDSNFVAFARLSAVDQWFYPTEFGFICEEYDATSPPTIRVVEVNHHGTEQGVLIAAKPLTGIGQRQRFVLSSVITKGIKGMNFVRDVAAAGGTCRGRFYWKGLFICSNTSAGYPTSPSSIDGLTSA